ncbi:hypothetical protein jhhlp_002255 [Lomentospora prolificans]|uniref:Vacuolar protein sorting/targeting protein 10 n=1 Tax=Lomentospora prolificans TaxID=41688 RepID=A0A2N3NDK7_9PEZI|nr:hypothetical protein jhhlp_002255 [Lomentospora prolificans]
MSTDAHRGEASHPFIFALDENPKSCQDAAMRFRGKAAASWRSILLSSMLWTAVAFAKSDTPTMRVTSFENPPRSLRYFSGSDDVLFHDPIERVIYRSEDAGTSWHKVEGVPAGAASALIMHTFDPKRAYILGRESEHYRTSDNGKTWHKFVSGADASFSDTDRISDEVLSFHAGDPDRIIFNGVRCKLFLCALVTTYTTDGFDSAPKDLRQFATGCWWAKSAPEFTTGDEELDLKRVLCIVEDGFTRLKEDQRLVISDNYFREASGEPDEFEPSIGSGTGILGAVNLASVKKFILVATSSLRTDEMALYVSTDTKKWHRAMFPQSHGHTINEGSYTVLESTNYSIQIDVMSSRPSQPMGVLFTSNSDGTYFTENVEYTNRNDMGLVDFEKISGIQGVFLVNTVDNGESLQKHGNSEREVVTKITFDDGRTFEKVMAGDERIHLHSVTHMINMGRVYSSPAPGLVMGNGNTGNRLKSLEKADLYVSDNAGVSWKKALDGPHKYDFGDQGSILVAVKHSLELPVSEFRYSLNHGDKWEQVSFPDDLKVIPLWLTTTQDSSTLKFILLGKEAGGDTKYHMISIDFDGLHERTCGDGDMEDWHARADSDGQPTCIMGHKQTFQRRKKDAECFIRKEFKESVAKTEVCECADRDFECDFNFIKDEDQKCIPDGPLIDSDNACKGKKPEDTFKGSSGWRKIPGNMCKRAKGEQKDDLVERKCSSVVGAPSSGENNGEIVDDHFSFKAKFKDFQKFYLERGDSSQRDDESLIVRPVLYEGGGMQVENKLWRTSNHGKKWERILEDEEIVGIYPHPTFNDVLFFTTPSEKVIYTVDRGIHFHSFKARRKPAADIYPFSFHPNKKDWIIMVGKRCDDSGESCYHEAHLSVDRGDNWKRLLHHVVKCEFTGNEAYKMRPQKQIVCLARDQDDDDAKENMLFVSDDFFDEDITNPKLIGDGAEGEASARNFATMSEFIIAAAAHEGIDGLVAFASMDGKTYAQAKFPVNLKADHSSEYTVLDSSTHAINMFVPTETREGHRYGNILKSNSNGTSYVLSASGVNCDDLFYVDYERIPGLEGVSVINTVANRDKSDEPKKLQTKITHNDGSEWYYLAPPATDVEGKAFPCRSAKGDSSCALHLHGFTQRTDKKKTYSVATAVGLMFGLGNVGPHLGSFEEADTFMTTDGGLTWKHVQKGIWTWQYGDQGSITVLVKQWRPGQKVKTNYVMYSTDEGETWKKHQFSEEEVAVHDITSPRSGSSRNFILWASKDSDETLAINLDFSGLALRPCKESDYYAWSPQDPAGGDGCLFGHKSKYLRKIKGNECYNDGRVRHELMVENCECTRRDFECAYNYELDSNGQCSLVEGLSPLSVEEWCKLHPDEPEYYEPTGYRRIPLTTCERGRELDKSLNSLPCKGHEEEYERRHRVSGVAIFFAVTIPFVLAGAAGWWVWRNWKSQFGQIRLGEPSAFDNEAPWVKYPVIAVSAVVAVVATVPLAATSLWRAATSTYQRVSGGSSGGGRSWLYGGTRRFTTRDSFARGMGDYADVDDVEGELLGEDSDEEI